MNGSIRNSSAQGGYPLVSGRPRDHLETPGDHMVIGGPVIAL
jgi:hypothetical protein